MKLGAFVGGGSDGALGWLAEFRKIERSRTVRAWVIEQRVPYVQRPRTEKACESNLLLCRSSVVLSLVGSVRRSGNPLSKFCWFGLSFVLEESLRTESQ